MSSMAARKGAVFPCMYLSNWFLKFSVGCTTGALCRNCSTRLSIFWTRLSPAIRPLPRRSVFWRKHMAASTHSISIIHRSDAPWPRKRCAQPRVSIRAAAKPIWRERDFFLILISITKGLRANFARPNLHCRTTPNFFSFAPSDILAGLHQAIAKRVLALVRKVGIADKFVITGGIGRNVGLVSEIEDRLEGLKVTLPQEPMIVGAVGAALFAFDQAKKT